MVLSRFFAFEKGQPAPRYAGRVPVILVMGDYEGGTAANYHGTTTLTQVMRGLWPELGARLESSDVHGGAAGEDQRHRRLPGASLRSGTRAGTRWRRSSTRSS